jgi:hypothetical protein
LYFAIELLRHSWELDTLDRDGRKIKPISLAGFKVVYLVKNELLLK